MMFRSFFIIVFVCSFATLSIGQGEIRPYDDRGRPNPNAFDWTGVAVGGNVGTLGFGADSTVYLGPNLNFRASLSFLPFDFEDEVDDVNFDMDVDFTTLRMLLDFYPSDLSVFRISAGIVYADNVIDLKSTTTTPEKIGDHVYTPSEVGTLSGSVTFDDWSPYVGIGFGNPVLPDTAFSAAVDIGIMFQTYNTTLTSDGTAAGDPVFESDLDQLKQDVDDELDNFKFYPVIQVSFSYHF